MQINSFDFAKEKSMNGSVHSKINKALDGKSTFVVWRNPGERKANFISGTSAKEILISDLGRENGFVVFPFEGEKGYLLQNDNPDFDKVAAKSPEYSVPYETSKADYLSLCSTFISAIQSGTFSKLILSRIKKIDRDKKLTLPEVFDQLCIQYPNAFVYLLSIPETGTWMAASPELLLSATDERIKTIALAGTQKKRGEDRTKIQWEEKESHEHGIVADFIEECFRKNNITIYHRSPAETVAAAQVWHLKTSFEAVPDVFFSIAQLVKDLHPTPAVCGMPKKEAQRFIIDNEKHQRNLYAGFLGEVNSKNNCRLFVNLRCMQVEDSAYLLYLGGGITADSNPEKEWEETEHKAETLTRIINQ